MRKNENDTGIGGFVMAKEIQTIGVLTSGGGSQDPLSQDNGTRGRDIHPGDYEFL